jgi:hypothetical protein
MKREPIVLTIDAFTPDTLPMSRLAEYLKPFAAMLGGEANVHFDRVFEGSAACSAFVEPQDAPKVRERVQGISSKTAPKSAMKAYADIDDLLAKDNASRCLQADGRIRTANVDRFHTGPLLLADNRAKPRPPRS